MFGTNAHAHQKAGHFLNAMCTQIYFYIHIINLPNHIVSIDPIVNSAYIKCLNLNIEETHQEELQAGEGQSGPKEYDKC